MSAGSLRLRELLERLAADQVEFILVGGLAVNAWGYLRATADVDMVPAPDAENLTRLAETLRGLGGRVEVAGARLAPTAIETFLRAGDRTLVSTELGEVDVLQGLPQVPPYAELEPAAQRIELDGLPVKVCSLESLIEMKRASSRPHDRDDLDALNEVRRARLDGS